MDGVLSSNSSKVNYASKSPDERRILELMNLLRFHPNKVTAIKSFEEWFFDNRPRLTTEYIRMLLQGKGGADTDGGLIQTIGDLSYSHVASRAALYLLTRLLDVEKNKDAALFLEQFVNFDASVLKKMAINQHIISERGNRIGAFKIIQILRNANVGGGGGGGGASGTGAGRVELQLEAIVNDSWALREFYKWAERKSDTSGQIVPFNHYGAQNKDNIYMKSLNLTSTNASAAATSASLAGGATPLPTPSAAEDSNQIKSLRYKLSELFQDMKRIMEEKDVFVSGADGNPISPAVNSSARGDPSNATTPWRLVNVVPQFDSAGRPILSASAGSFDEDVSLFYRKHVKQDMVVVKMQCIVPYRMEEIAPYLADLRRRKEWDLKFFKGKCLEQRASQEYAVSKDGQPIPLQYPEYQSDIVHMIFKSFSSPYKYRDVVVVRSFTQVDKTRREFEEQGFKQRQQLAPAGAAAAQQPYSHPASSGDDSHDGSATGREWEDPIFKEGVFADGGMLFGTRSVIHAQGPEFKDNVRAVLYPTGYILVPLRDQPVDIHPLPGSPPDAPVQSVSDLGCACQLTIVMQMDRESVLIVSPDLLGETNELRQTFNNIKACLARDYGLRTLQPSAHTQQLRMYAGRVEDSMDLGSMHHGGHVRAPSVLASQHPTPSTYKQRHPTNYDDGSDNEGGSRASSVYNSGRNSSVVQPQGSPQMRGNAGLPVIRER